MMKNTEDSNSLDYIKLISQSLKYYSNKEIQNRIFSSSLNREFVPKIITNNGFIFGERPNSINYPNDIFQFVKQKAISFHFSEEQWFDPMLLSKNISEKEINENRIAWDLIIDIDFPVFEGSKIIASQIINALKDHGIKTIYLKFSGNKGFHIALPFSIFPKRVYNNEMKDLFPDAPIKILKYLNYYIDNQHNEYITSKKIISKLEELNEDLPKNLINYKCLDCDRDIPILSDSVEYVYLCKNCGNQKIIKNQRKNYLICDNCNHIMELKEIKKPRCPFCQSKRIIQKIDLGLDSILISKRHLVRTPYSLHEKSLLVSLPVRLEDLDSFKREYANPNEVKPKLVFLPSNEQHNKMEAEKLVIQAFDFEAMSKKRIQENFNVVSFSTKKTIDERTQYKITSKINQEYFPPCILLGLNGLEDGRKRFLFILINFLKTLNWNEEEIISLVKEWNEKNKEKLKDGIINVQLKYHLKKEESMPPPNCFTQGYYVDIEICNPDNICKKIKNPVSYSRHKYSSENKRKIKKQKKE